MTLQQCQCFFLMAVRGKILIHEISDSKWSPSSCSSQYLIRSTHQEIPKFILHHCPQLYEIIFRRTKVFLVHLFCLHHPFYAKFVAPFNTNKDVSSPIDLLAFSIALAEYQVADDDGQNEKMLQLREEYSKILRTLMG